MRAGPLKKKQLFLVIWILLFTFQDFLSSIFSPFAYIDEAPLILFLFTTLLKTVKTGKLTIRRENRNYVTALFVFVLTGFIGNILFQYQPFTLVLTDLLTNLKFFGAIAFFSSQVTEDTLDTKRLSNTAKALTLILFTIFLLDRVLNLYPAEVRYGIRSAKLFYGHPTYFAGICGFLAALMSIYDASRHKFYIALDLIMLVFTLRSKAIVCAILFVVLYIIIKKLHGKLKKWQIAVLAVFAVAVGWSQIYFYYISLSGSSARSAMLLTSFQIMKDYFPIGTGFGTYASHSASASVSYSPVYVKYGFDRLYELRNSSVGTFFDDQFWPIIFGQTGVIGTVSYLYILLFLFRKIQKLFRIDRDAYLAGLFIFVYLLVSSIAEPAFNNSVAIPLAMILGITMKKATMKIEKTV